jgi:hypothetical protein
MFKKLLEEFEQTITELENVVEPVTKEQLDMLERYLDSLYAKNNMDFEFTRHFIDRVNDPRNAQPITFDELKKMFIDSQKRYGISFSRKHRGFQAAIRSVGAKLNAPFVIDIHPRTGKLDLVTKTIMRKDNFHTPGPIYNVESVNPNLTGDIYNMWVNNEKAYNMIVNHFNPDIDTDGSFRFESGHQYDRACDLLHSLGFNYEIDYGDANIDPIDSGPSEHHIDESEWTAGDFKIGDRVRVKNSQDKNYFSLTGTIAEIKFELDDPEYPYAIIKPDNTFKDGDQANRPGHIEATFPELEKIESKVIESLSADSYNKILRFGITKTFDVIQKKAQRENSTLISIIQNGIDSILNPIVSMIADKLGSTSWFNKDAFYHDLEDTVKEIAISNTHNVNESILNEVIQKVHGKWTLMSKKTGRPLRYYHYEK